MWAFSVFFCLFCCYELMNLIYLQVSMLGSRFAVLMLFTRIFKQWVLGVIGKSWRYRTCLKVQICCLHFLWSKDVSEDLPIFSTIKTFSVPTCASDVFVSFQVCTGWVPLSGWCLSRPTSYVQQADGDSSTSSSVLFTSFSSWMWSTDHPDIAWLGFTWYVWVCEHITFVQFWTEEKASHQTERKKNTVSTHLTCHRWRLIHFLSCVIKVANLV